MSRNTITSRDPGYPTPAEDLVEESLMDALFMADIVGWKYVALDVEEIIPRENIIWVRRKDFRIWLDHLIDQWKMEPEKIKPIAVARRDGKHLILDGHHRWRAAKEAGRKMIWVVQVKGPLRDPRD